MSTRDDVRAAAREMTTAKLSDKVDGSREDCAFMQMRLDNLTETGEKDSPEARSIVRAHELACAWASEGAAELAKRGKAKPAAKPRARRSPAPAPAAETPEYQAPEKASAWTALLGVGGVIGVGALAWWGLSKTIGRK